MSKWVKPNELPEGFWGECFVAINDGTGQIFTEINDVKRMYEIPRWYSTTEEGWFEFRKDSEEHRTLVMPVMKPTITVEDFK